MKKVLLFFAVAFAVAACTSKSTPIVVESADSTVVMTDSTVVDSIAVDSAKVAPEVIQ